MKKFFKNNAILFLLVATFGLSYLSITMLLAGILMALVCLGYGASCTFALGQQTSNQLRNLYTLTALTKLPRVYADTLTCQTRTNDDLARWEERVFINALAEGATLESADSARFNECRKYARYIAQAAEERVIAGCNSAKSWDRKETLCQDCAAARIKAAADWQTILAQEKAAGKRLDEHKYGSTTHWCPAPKRGSAVAKEEEPQTSAS